MLEMLYAVLGRLFFFTGAVQDGSSYPKPLSAKDEEKYLALARTGYVHAIEILEKHYMRHDARLL